MKILVLNRGSSSLKCCFYQFDSFPKEYKPPVGEALLEWKNNFENMTLKLKTDRGTEQLFFTHQTQALEYIVHSLCPKREQIDAIGHRIVHGGKFFHESLFIDASVKNKIRYLSELAPLHNLADLEGIELFEEFFPKTPQFAVFDTAFHHTLPDCAAIYPGPYAWIEEGIRRYGFHGTSFQYCTRRASELLARDPQKMVICHLGSGASLCAIKNGKSIDTTMGFTPLEGLMMDTRSGSIDPGILLYLLSKKKRTVDDLSKELYEKSGLLGLSGTSSDMRDILIQVDQGNARAKLALEVYIHRLNSGIGSMVASLNGLDTLVFTAGIGEHASLVRSRVCESLSFLGIKLDVKKNELPQSQDCDLSLPDSKVKIFLIHTQELFEIARECWKKLLQH